ncbi:MAG: hypothetical protein JWP25_7559 [Bradyrhizobium sp.]|nr:hypothetical protein [Bradyrhizobium sp.]
MSNETNPAATAAGADARYDVKISARFPYLGFDYMPGHKHEVDQDVLDAMTAAGVVADVKHIS